MQKAIFLLLLGGCCVQTLAQSATKTLTFDRFSPGMDHESIPNGYGGLEWSNFGVLNAVNQGFRTGYRLGIVSQKNVAFNPYGEPAALSRSTPFDLHSGYFTAAVLDGLELHVRAYLGETLKYETTKILSATEPALVTFDFTGVTRVEFATIPESQFAVDNLRLTTPGNTDDSNEVTDPDPGPAGSIIAALGRIEVASVGSSSHSGPGGIVFNAFLINQSQNSGGGGMLPNVLVNWDTNSQFAITIAAPESKKFLIRVPAGASAGFGGFLWWEAGDRGGFSPSGPISVAFQGSSGPVPTFTESDAVLSSSHGFFGVMDLESTMLTDNFAFTSMTIVGSVSPQVTGLGARDFVPHSESSLSVYSASSEVSVEIVPNTQPAASQDLRPRLRITRGAEGETIITFSGTLQQANSTDGDFKDVPGAPQGSYVVPAGPPRFFRTR